MSFDRLLMMMMMIMMITPVSMVCRRGISRRIELLFSLLQTTEVSLCFKWASRVLFENKMLRLLGLSRGRNTGMESRYNKGVYY